MQGSDAAPPQHHPARCGIIPHVLKGHGAPPSFKPTRLLAKWHFNRKPFSLTLAGDLKGSYCKVDSVASKSNTYGIR